ncbi:MAG TPA: hypothetical protein VGF59_26005, partial [Bryobacteraceae bacterium]
TWIDSMRGGEPVQAVRLATSLYREPTAGFLEAAREVKDAGRFDSLDRALATGGIPQLMG